MASALRREVLGALAGDGPVLFLKVNVPASLLDTPLRDEAAASGEGVVLCDVLISQGAVSAVTEAGKLLDASGAATVECKGAMLWPCFVDAHTHLVKTNAVPRCRNPSGAINDALACEVSDQPRWYVEGDVARRMDFALRCAWHHGTRAARTHLDGTNSPDKELRDLVYGVFDEAREKWVQKGFIIQGVANLYLPLYTLEADMASAHAAEAAKHAGVCLGAYCGDVSLSTKEQTEGALDALFALAKEHSLDVDLHIDETNNPKCCGVAHLCTALERARAAGYAGKVVLGHVTSLALQESTTRDDVIARLAALAPVTVVCNPFTNLGLQDRRGTAPPIGELVDRETPRTPLWRGLTLVQELRAAGVPVAAASDNVRDWWHPYGDYDCLAVWREALTLGHLDTAPREGDWADLVTSVPAAAMGLASTGLIAAGAPADLVLFPSARRVSELLARPQHDRLVVRSGQAQESDLPPYEELDDLVEEPTNPVDTTGAVQRGATKTSGETRNLS